MKKRILAGAALWTAFALERPLSLSPYTAWLLCLPLLFYCAWPFHLGLLRGLRDRRIGLQLLVSTSAWAMFLLSTAAVFLAELLPPELREHRLWSLAAMLTLVNLGLWIEARLQKKSPETLARLMARIPKLVRVERGGSETVIPLSELRPGDRAVVRPGEPVPLDGQIVEGESRLDESLRTGVSEPVEKSRGSRVYGGAINKTGRLVVAVTDLQQAAALRRIFEEVCSAAAERQASGRPVDPVARSFFAAILLAAVGAAMIGAFKGPHPHSLYAAAAFLSVLSSACPWAIALAAPLAVYFGGRRGASLGIGLRNPRMLESFQKPDTVVFDKTGVLTEGRPEVSGIQVFNGWERGEALRLLLAAEAGVAHPLAGALRRYAQAQPRSSDAPQRRAFEVFPNRGVSATLDGRRVLVGSLDWLAHHGIELEPGDALRLKGQTQTLVGVAVDGRFAAVAEFSDRLRTDIRGQIARLQQAGIEPILISGDGNTSVFRTAEQAGVPKIYAEALEDEKAGLVARLREKGRRVAVLGEGLRDCAALGEADVGFCPAGSGALAEAAADFTIERRDLGGFFEAVRLALDVRAAIRRNFVWMFAVHALLIPVSVGALYLRAPLKPALLAAAAAAAFAAVLFNSARLLARPLWRPGK
ncbi:MAG: heavy metal translocating P-type ATPase [Elusimicrobia bacterium]|nr:heavy metal translocating P-type ATPase [Elusimicrobiota bacterium]